MTTRFQQVGLLAKTGDARVAAAVAQCMNTLQEAGCDVLIGPNVHGLLGGGSEPPVPLEEIARRAQLLVVVGGDGTILAAARQLAGHAVPIVGVNAGRLGFLADLPADAVPRHLGAILDGAYVEEQRRVLKLDLDNSTAGPVSALNDVVVQKHDHGRMIEFTTWVDGRFVCAHRADGLVIATPTGSTAYALSAGGPIMHPALDAITLVPICPHTLTDRPIVVSGSAQIEVRIEGHPPMGAQVTCDGQASRELGPGDTVRVALDANTISLLHPEDYDYFKILRNKLHWGRDQDSDIGR